MPGYGKYGDAEFRERERDFERERPFERAFERVPDRPPRERSFSGRDGEDRDRGFFGGSRTDSDEDRRGLPIDETSRLIASNKVEGTAVYGRDGERLGTIYNFMVDKFTGRVEYAVMSYGGFLGMAQRYYPLPWRILTYDTREGGYRIEMTDRDLERAPSFGRDDEPRFNRDYGRRVHNWYGLDY